MQKQIDLAELASVDIQKVSKEELVDASGLCFDPQVPRNCGGPICSTRLEIPIVSAWASSVSSWSLRTMRRLCKIQFLTFYSGKRAVFDPIAHLWDTLSLRRHP